MIAYRFCFLLLFFGKMNESSWLFQLPTDGDWCCLIAIVGSFSVICAKYICCLYPGMFHRFLFYYKDLLLVCVMIVGHLFFIHPSIHPSVHLFIHSFIHLWDICICLYLIIYISLVIQQISNLTLDILGCRQPVNHCGQLTLTVTVNHKNHKTILLSMAPGNTPPGHDSSTNCTRLGY